MSAKISKSTAKIALVAGLVVILSSSFCLADFATLDRQTNQNQAALELGFTIPDDGDGFALRTELYGQFYYKWIGAYLDLPFNFLILENAGDESAMGNMELGLFHVIELGTMFSLCGRFGIGVPTAADDFGGFSANASGGLGRLTDLYAHALPEATSIRPSISALMESDLLFARLDVGLDVIFPDSGDHQLYLRLNLGVGVHAGPVDFTVEMANLGLLERGGDVPPGDASNYWLHTMAFNVSLPSETVQPYLAYVLPLDDAIRGELHMLSMGVAGRF